MKSEDQRERRFARALRLARRRLVRLRIVAEGFGPVPPERWLEPFPLGFALRHLWWAGEEAGVWRFGLPFPRWPDSLDTRRVLEPAWRAAFPTPYDIADQRIADWSARPAADPANAELVEGLRRADRILGAVVRGSGDPIMERPRVEYAALKRRQKRLTVMFSPDRLYAFCVYHGLWVEQFGQPLPEGRLVRALWPRARRWEGDDQAGEALELRGEQT